MKSLSVASFPLPYSRDPLPDLNPLLQHDKIALQCPDCPDADSLASAFGLHRFFSERGKTPLLFYAGSKAVDSPNLREMINAFSLPLEHKPGSMEWDGLLVTINCQYGAQSLTCLPAHTISVIDVHVQETDLPAQSTILPYLSSCSTLVWQLLEKAGFPIDRTLSTALMYGLHSASKGFSELRFPLDRDLRDTLYYDIALFERLCRSNLCMDDLARTAKALDAVNCHRKDGLLLVNVLPGPADILRFIGDLGLHVQGVDIAVIFSENEQGFHFSVRSGTKAVKAGELACWLAADGLGTGGGERVKGGGFISAGPYANRYPGLEALVFFRNRFTAYLEAYTVCDCLAEPLFPTDTLHAYQKCPVLHGFVRCSEAFPKRTRLHIRMLEGDIVINATPETYLMIGLAGEVYPIEKRTFENAYTPVDTLPDLNILYSPVVLDKDSRTRVDLLRYAKGCMSREKRVLAKQLAHGLKIFTLWDRDSYLTGNPGDWLVQRKENERDRYIVKQDIFSLLYKKAHK